MNNVGTAPVNDEAGHNLPKNSQPARVEVSLFEWTVTAAVAIVFLGFLIGEPIYRLYF